MKLLKLLLLLLAFAVPAVALSSDTETIKRQIAHDIKASGQLSQYSIAIKYEAGTAWLSGRVKNSAQREAASQLALRVPGVQRVSNQIELPLADEPESSDFHTTSFQAGERVTQLPEDANGWFLSVFTTDDWRGNARELRFVGWFDTVPELAQLKSQTHWNHYTPRMSMYGRYAGTATDMNGQQFTPLINYGATGVVLQDASGAKIYWCMNSRLPKDPQVLVEKIREHIKQRHTASAEASRCNIFHRPQPCPDPCPGPCPQPGPQPQPNYTPVLPDEPNLGPDEGVEEELIKEEEEIDDLVAILCAIPLAFLCLGVGYIFSASIDSARGG